MKSVFCPVCNRQVRPIEDEGLIVCPRCHSIIARSSDLHEEQARQPEEQPKQSTERYSSTGEVKSHKGGKIAGIVIGCIAAIVVAIILVGPTETPSSPSIPPVNPPTTTQPASAPAPLGLSRDNPVPMGQSLVTPQGIELTMLNIIKGNAAWDIIHEANQFNDPPDAGMQYILITVKAKNVSSEEEPYLISDMDIGLVGSSNKVVYTFDRSVVLPDEGDLSELWVETYHGGEVIGSLHFYIPNNETNLVLIWDAGIFNKNKRFYEVKYVTTQPTPAPTTPMPTPITEPKQEEQKPDLILIKSWSGSGIKTTEPFTMSKEPWVIVWSNKREIMEGYSIGLLQIYVYNTDNPDLPISLAANTQEETLDTSYVYKTGTFYLMINAANTEWEVTVLCPN